MPNEERQRAEPISDVSDRATVEEQATLDDALSRQRANAARLMPGPTPDGDCACGCGEPVEPQRLKLGLGFTLDCAQRREKLLVRGAR